MDTSGIGEVNSGGSDSFSSGSNDDFNSGSNDEFNEAPDEDSSNADTPADVIKLSWNAPLYDATGAPLTDLGGYNIYYLKDDTTTQILSIDVGNVTSARIAVPSLGTWCFEVTAYDESGIESDFSNKACTVI